MSMHHNTQDERGCAADSAGLKRILFVDDDVPVLNGLRARLHRLRHKWDMHFADSGASAIEALERNHFDVVVTDMRMPGMDGAELLRIVNERWPDAVRIVLSGYAELQQVIRLVPYAHQYFSKPCEAGQLENLIERCLSMHELLRQPGLRAVVGSIRRLPTMPRIYSQFQSILTKDSTSVHDIAKLIAQDPAIAAKVLQLVNSAFFRLARRITNIEQAVSHLGFAAIRNMVLSAEVFSRWPGSEASLNIDKLQSHVHQVAAAARSLPTRGQAADDALLAGLLHDIGYWILAHECKAELSSSLKIAVAQRMPLHEAEIQVIGASHAQIGAYLLGLWGLPYTVIEAVAHHHTPLNVPLTEFDTLAAIAVAHALVPADDTEAFDTPLTPDPGVNESYLAAVKAPFDWTEATRRIKASLTSNEA
jgi:HD-like signal output (HDOD) protein/ActR/RegA family two-component response regulator